MCLFSWEGGGKQRNLMLPDRCLGLTANRADPHVSPPVAQLSVLCSTIGGVPWRKGYWEPSVVSGGWIVFWEPQRRITYQEAAELPPQLSFSHLQILEFRSPVISLTYLVARLPLFLPHVLKVLRFFLLFSPACCIPPGGKKTSANERNGKTFTPSQIRQEMGNLREHVKTRGAERQGAFISMVPLGHQAIPRA